MDTPISKSVDITNTGTKDITALHMTYTSSSTNLHAYTLTWNCEGLSLQVGYVITATFNLTVSEATEGAFTINISINPS
jgi:hypothetical protein